ncbi:LytS/YhcK type 5TM receptor domain-containing protein [Pseudogracilibacillus sp. ICA-222130]|uniref:LytS/YhcK type 5TM receptor domain-containing protein n=1 Tax=Pseudogracilibacillus sp. ICA-222130 TaxID=3134655 RepID=UPI0030C32A5E
MKELTIILLERIGLLLVIAFVLTRIPSFKTMLYREFDAKTVMLHSFIFGVFGIVSSHFGLIFKDGAIINRGIVTVVQPDEMLISLSIIAIVIAGLLGGPLVGLGAGIIVGIHLGFLGGIGWVANVLINPLTGLLAGLTGRFFSKARVISPIQALFIGVFPPILQMQLLLVLYPQNEQMIQFVNVIGLPLVLASSIAIAVFTAMIGIVLAEQENEAAQATRQALTIAEEALPFLRMTSAKERAEGLASLLYDRLDIAAISVIVKDELLAFKGIGADHHTLGPVQKKGLLLEAVESDEVKVAYRKADIDCPEPSCQLEACIIIPITSTNGSKSIIQFYFTKSQHIRPVEIVLAQGLGKLISNQLKVIANENLRKNIVDAELRNLQAQINPHFLFNTLHLIATLFRIDPQKARNITLQLASFMRFNLGITSESLISLERECEHVRAYIEIIQTRFSKQLHINFEVDPTVMNIQIPPSTIQPLVENSIQHGLKNKASGGKIDVTIEREKHYVKISVKDNGIGFDPKKLDTLYQKGRTTSQTDQIDHGGVGLFNVNQRLISLLGDESSLQFKNLREGGSIVYFYIPNSISVRRNNDEIERDDSRR